MQGLELAFIDCLASAADIGDARGQLRPQLRGAAFCFEQPVARQVAFTGQLTQAIELLLLKLQLRGVVALDLFKALELLGERGHFVLADLHAAGQLGAAGGEQIALQLHRRNRPWIVRTVQQGRRPLHMVAVQALRYQPILDRPGADPLAQGHIQLRLGLDGVELHQHLALAHLVAFAHQYAVNHAAGERLHGLALAGDHHGAAADHAAVQRRQAGPQQEAAQAHEQEPDTDPGNARGIRVGRGSGGGDIAQTGLHGRLRLLVHGLQRLLPALAASGS
ncbi:hypothetical protein D3C76_1076960 [compost metagenome]